MMFNGKRRSYVNVKITYCVYSYLYSRSAGPTGTAQMPSSATEVRASVTGAGFCERHGYRRTGSTVACSVRCPGTFVKELREHAG